MIFGKIDSQNWKNFRFLFLLSCWLILFFSASAINSTLLNKVDGQTSGSYHYAPGLALTGSNYHDVTSTNSLQLSQFSVAAWFKTS
ncbi:MAG: hypothetical protein WA390_09600, partial [Nitrososphaeraceae archaeon]